MIRRTMTIHIPSHLSDAELVAEVKCLAGPEREATTLLISHLAEFDRRRLYLGAGFPSMFVYCIEVLSLSEAAAYNRIEVARTARAFPSILEMLGDGRLNLATVRVLAPRLTDDIHQELLAAASRQSRRKVEELVAWQFPQPDVAASVRKLPAPKPMPGSIAPPDAGERAVPAQMLAHPLPAASRPVVSPLAPDRYQIRFTASASTCEKLRQAQDLLRHAIPTGDTGEIFDRALTLLLKELARKRFATTDRPRRSRGPAPGSRNVAAKVRRVVSRRDDGRCAYVGTGGRRCNARAFVEFHHVDPHGVGGEATVAKTELRCRAHNNYEAELFYGRRWPEQRTVMKTLWLHREAGRR
jgi:hypothetical protein